MQAHKSSMNEKTYNQSFHKLYEAATSEVAVNMTPRKRRRQK